MPCSGYGWSNRSHNDLKTETNMVRGVGAWGWVRCTADAGDENRQKAHNKCPTGQAKLVI